MKRYKHGHWIEGKTVSERAELEALRQLDAARTERQELEALRALDAAKNGGNRALALAMAEREKRRRGTSPSIPGEARELQNRVRQHGTRGDFSTAQGSDSTFETVGRQALRRFVDNILGLPAVVGEGLASAGALPQAAIESGINVAQGQPANFMDAWRQQFAQEKGQFPARNLIQGGQLDTGQIMAAGQAFPQAITDPNLSFAEANQQALADQQEADFQLREQHPHATLAGDIAGDAATLLTGRAPAAGALRRFTTPAKRRSTATPGTVKREFQDFVNKPFMQGVERNLRRAAETGVEGASLAILTEGDPAEVALYSAAAQSTGSLVLSTLNEARKRPLTMLAGTVLALQLLKQGVPGVDPNIFESQDSFLKKGVAVIGTGLAAGAAGLGRVPRAKTSTEGPIRVMLDQIATPALRTPMHTAFRALSEESQAGGTTIRTVLEKYSSDPGYFGSTARGRIEAALESGNPERLVNEIESLRENRAFRSKLDELN